MALTLAEITLPMSFCTLPRRYSCFLVLWQMTGACGRAPWRRPCLPSIRLRVESVAWVTERKDVLSGLFFMLTLAAYVGYAADHFRWGVICW